MAGDVPSIPADDPRCKLEQRGGDITMAILRPPFDLASATVFSAPDRLITFPDRYTSATPIAPARFENSQLWLMTLTPAAGHTTIPLQCPADSGVKSVDLQAADAAAL